MGINDNFLSASRSELITLLLEKKKRLMELRLRKIFLKPAELSELRTTRRMIARIMTAMNSRNIRGGN